VPFLRNWILGAPGDWRMLPTSANGQPAAVGYRLAADGARHAYGVVVLAVTGTGISRIVSFGDPALASLFGFPATLPANQPS
jgi:RNA polymerase sigma-70 factor (ECF subfamily)